MDSRTVDQGGNELTVIPIPSDHVFSDISDLHQLVELISDKLGNPVTIELITLS